MFLDHDFRGSNSHLLGHTHMSLGLGNMSQRKSLPEDAQFTM